MTQVAVINPPYSQIAICDPTAKVEVPPWENDFTVVATDTYIGCICFLEQDGKTEVRLGRGDQSQPGLTLKYDGMLKTPGGVVAVETVEGDSVMRLQTGATEVRVRIWTNAKQWPTKVSIGID